LRRLRRSGARLRKTKSRASRSHLFLLSPLNSISLSNVHFLRGKSPSGWIARRSCGSFHGSVMRRRRKSRSFALLRMTTLRSGAPRHLWPELRGAVGWCKGCRGPSTSQNDRFADRSAALQDDRARWAVHLASRCEMGQAALASGRVGRRRVFFCADDQQPQHDGEFGQERWLKRAEQDVVIRGC
jgi:hypothetical protein